jgi:peptidylprolyl isomerase
VLCLLGSGCASEGSIPTDEPIPSAPTPDEILRDTFDRILRLEDARSDGDGELQRLAFALDPRLRARATRALGRLPFPEHGPSVSGALLRSLADVDPAVRALAAFGLGLRADPATAVELLAAWKDGDAQVRARIVEAASRYEDRGLREEVLYSLSDPSPLVRTEAATGPHRWEPGSSGAAIVDIALRNVAAKAPAALRRQRWGAAPELSGGPAEDGAVIRAALFSLARRKSARGLSVFLLWCRAPNDALARVFATQGLAALDEATAESRQALRECLEDEDWRVVVEAAGGLARSPEPASVPALERALAHPLGHVRAGVARALGAFRGQRLQVQHLLERLLVDVSPNVRAAAIRSLAQLFGAEVAADLEARALDGEPMVRKAVVESCAQLPAEAGLPLLLRLTSDEDKAVAFAAVSGLRDFLEAGGRARAHELLRSDDNGLRLGAVLALQEAPVETDLQPLLHCYESSRGDIADEIRYEILNTAVKLSDDRAFEILNEGLRATERYTRELARRHLAERFPGARIAEPAPLPPRRCEVPVLDPLPSNPRVEVRTSRGTLLFELFPREAPLHVYNFLTLAREGAYDGLRFHRVVADFVVQGGDYRGDGNGGCTWRGEPLRHEFNPLKYVEGSLGMPRNQDPDSGGSQFFVTHRPTPHLDGRYTLFGELRQGFEVLRGIEEGDLILAVRVRGE